MRGLNKTQRNYVIIGLCAILLIMAVGYAAFSTNLQIKGTTDITSNWDLHIKDGGVNPENVVEATSTKSIKVDASTAEFACELTTPGKSKIDYVIEVENSGTLNAKLDRINVTGSTNAISITTTPTNENLTNNHLIVGANGGTAKIKVTVSYNDVTTQPNAEDLKANIKVTLDFSQTDEEATSVGPSSATFTGTIYRNNYESAHIGDSIVPESVTKYVITNGQHDAPFGPYDTEEECNADKVAKGAPDGWYCQQKTFTTGGVGEYTTNASTLDKTYYLKHDVVDDIITASYTCFVFNDTEYCMQGGNSSYYAANKALIENLITTYSLNGYANDNDSYCSVGGFPIYASSDGGVTVYGDQNSRFCDISKDNASYCKIAIQQEI